MLRNPIVWATLAATVASTHPASAFADGALFSSVTIGGAVVSPGTSPRFRVGLGLDWLHDSGASAAVRAATLHDLDIDVSALGGWLGPGIVRDEGLPIGVSVGPSLTRHSEGQLAVGGRGIVTWGLFYNRVAIELGLTLSRRIGRRAPADLQSVVGLVLRVSPWGPWGT